MATTHELRGDFQTEVLERSHQVPVLVDFWAEWCGPCRMLGPVLESLAERAGGRWELVKVDTEAHQQVALQYAIRSIPAVKLFHAGKPVAEFVGALPEPQIVAWLEQHLPGPADGLYREAQEALAVGNTALAMERLVEVLERKPEHGEARFELARLQMRDDVAAARRTLAGFEEGDPDYDTAQRLLHLLGKVEWAKSGEPALAGAATASDETVETYRQAALAFAAGDLPAALGGWVQVMMDSRDLDDDGARNCCLAVFALLGEEHELTQSWRRRFSMALHG